MQCFPHLEILSQALLGLCTTSFPAVPAVNAPVSQSNTQRRARVRQEQKQKYTNPTPTRQPCHNLYGGPGHIWLWSTSQTGWVNPQLRRRGHRVGLQFYMLWLFYNLWFCTLVETLLVPVKTPSKSDFKLVKTSASHNSKLLLKSRRRPAGEYTGFAKR